MESNKHIHTHEHAQTEAAGQQYKFNKVIAPGIVLRERTDYTYIHIAYNLYLNMIKGPLLNINQR